MKHPQEVSHFSPNQLLTYVQHVGSVSRSSRSGASDLTCYNHYLPLLGDVPNQVRLETEACTATLEAGVLEADGKLVEAKASADDGSTTAQGSVVECNNITDPEESLGCHSHQVSFRFIFLNWNECFLID